MTVRRWLVRTCIVWPTVCAVVALFADLLPLADYRAMDLRARLWPPVGFGGGWTHPFGTDELGRDVLVRVIEALRVSFALALFGTVAGAVLGTTLGFLAAHLRGLVDDVVMVLVDIQASIPFFMIAVIVIAVFGASLPLFVALIALFGWERYARLARALALSAAEQGYVEALRGLGAGPERIYAFHVLPNVASPLIVNATLNFPETVLMESALSFLGIGIQPPMVSLGNMVGYGQEFLTTGWWIAAAPSAVIFFSTLSMGVLGDALRDHLDPAHR